MIHGRWKTNKVSSRIAPACHVYSLQATHSEGELRKLLENTWIEKDKGSRNLEKNARETATQRDKAFAEGPPWAISRGQIRVWVWGNCQKTGKKNPPRRTGEILRSVHSGQAILSFSQQQGWKRTQFIDHWEESSENLPLVTENG